MTHRLRGCTELQSGGFSTLQTLSKVYQKNRLCQEHLEHIRNLPLVTPPGVFGFHENANLTKERAEHAGTGGSGESAGNVIEYAETNGFTVGQTTFHGLGSAVFLDLHAIACSRCTPLLSRP